MRLGSLSLRTVNSDMRSSPAVAVHIIAHSSMSLRCWRSRCGRMASSSAVVMGSLGLAGCPASLFIRVMMRSSIGGALASG